MIQETFERSEICGEQGKRKRSVSAKIEETGERAE